jgi:hypothetical protein
MLVMTHGLAKFAFVPFTFVLALGATGCSRGSKHDRVAPIGLPTIQIPEPKHDFGQVTEGGKLTHVFKVRNVGAGALHIDQVRTSCGCTAAVLKNKEIAPGGEGQIEVTFDTNHRSGDQSKTIVVTSDDPVKPSVNLEIHTNVQVLLAFELGFMQLHSEPGKTQVVETWLTGSSKEHARLKVLDKPAEHELAAKVIEKPVDGGVGVQGLRFTLFSRQSGFGSGNVNIETGLANPDKLQIGYAWTVAGNIEVSPVSLLFTDAKGDSSVRVLRVTSHGPDFHLRKALVSGPFVANIEVPDSGVGYEVRVSLKKGASFPSGAVTVAGKLELFSNDPIEPKKEVQIKFAPSLSPSASPSAMAATQSQPGAPRP